MAVIAGVPSPPDNTATPLQVVFVLLDRFFRILFTALIRLGPGGTLAQFLFPVFRYSICVGLGNLPAPLEVCIIVGMPPLPFIAASVLPVPVILPDGSSGIAVATALNGLAPEAARFNRFGPLVGCRLSLGLSDLAAPVVVRLVLAVPLLAAESAPQPFVFVVLTHCCLRIVVTPVADAIASRSVRHVAIGKGVIAATDSVIGLSGRYPFAPFIISVIAAVPPLCVFESAIFPQVFIILPESNLGKLITGVTRGGSINLVSTTGNEQGHQDNKQNLFHFSLLSGFPQKGLNVWIMHVRRGPSKK